MPDTTWQVVTHVPDSTTLDTLVWDFAELDGVMYVGGSFAQVRQGSGYTPQNQAFLAAFDVDTGVWIDTFRPVLDGAVFTVEVAADGSHLVIGGEFTGGLAAIDPASGARWGSWDTTVAHDVSDYVVMDLEPDGVGGWYIGGTFTHVDDGTGQQRRGRLARLDAAGNLDAQWRPSANGGRVWTLARSVTQNWVHIGGYHVSTNSQPESGYFSTVSAVNGDLITTVPHEYPEGAISSEGFIAQKIHGIVSTPETLWVGGEPHTLIALDPNTLEVQRFWFTNRGLGDVSAGGDTQAIFVTDDRVYAGCHCWGSVGQYEPLAPGEWEDYRAWVAWFATQSNPSVKAVFAVDRAGRELSETFQPVLTGDDGVWAIIEDSNGNMWFGGEFTSAAGSYPGGFVRYSEGGAPTPDDVVPTGSDWRHQNSSVTPAAAWNTVGYNDASWASGPGQLGFGDGDEATVLDRNLWGRSAYFRHEVDLQNTATASAVALEVVADDGFVAYVNGVEVGRVRVPDGPLSATTFATEAIWGAAERTPTRLEVPPSLLVDGANVIAVQVHNSSNGGDLSFDASLQADSTAPLTDPDPPQPAGPPPPLLWSDYNTDTRVTLRWTHDLASDAVSYNVYRDGVLIYSAATTAYTDQNVVAGAQYQYRISSTNADGQESALGNAVDVTAGVRTFNTRAWIRHPNYEWQLTQTDPGDGWADPDFDDTAWATGERRVGYGENGLDTVVPQTSNDLWLRATQVVPASRANPDALLVFLNRDDAAAVYINGHEVARDNMAPGPFGNPLRSLWGGSNERTQYLLIPGDLIVEGENTFAVHVRNSAGSGDMQGYLGLLGFNWPNLPGPAPSAPSAPSASVGTDSVQLSWAPATDDGAVASYLIRRDGVPIGSSWTTDFHDPAPTGDHTYEIIAMDDDANKGPAVSLFVNGPVQPPDPPVETALVDAATTWRFLDDGTDPGATWRDLGHDDAAWLTGTGQFGFGDGDEATELARGSRGYFFRTTFDATDVASVTALDLGVIRDDGIAVYLNGVEVYRDNLATDAAFDSLADGAVWGADERDPMPVVIDPSLLVEGTNVLTVEVHNESTNGGDLSFAADLVSTAPAP